MLERATFREVCVTWRLDRVGSTGARAVVTQTLSISRRPTCSGAETLRTAQRRLVSAVELLNAFYYGSVLYF